ncbi:MAG: rhomboid family intramembrane serine protease [Verrucomicrobiota bacterium]|nr:rhomboid family intramembrane serine protease [Verrucomicrobiota bacterium]
MLDDRDYMRSSEDSMFSFANNKQKTPWSAVKTLLIINIAIFLGQNLFPPLTNILFLHAPAIKNFEIWRIFTYMFAHGSFSHILFNMWGLYLFGKPVEQRIGKQRFFYLFFVSGLVGGGIWLLFNWLSPYPVLGASGAVFGLLIAAAMTYPNMRIILLFPPIPMKLKTFAWGYAILEVVLFFKGGSNIAHIAHLGGALGGFMYMNRLKKSKNPFKRPFGEQFFGKMRDFATSFEKSEDIDEDIDMSSIDKVLDKVGRSGLQSLTPKERKILDKARDRLKA